MIHINILQNYILYEKTKLIIFPQLNKTKNLLNWSYIYNKMILNYILINNSL